MKKLLLSLMACGSLMISTSEPDKHELNETEKESVTYFVLMMTAIDVACVGLIAPVMYDASSFFTTEKVGMTGVMKGAGLGFGLASMVVFSELFKNTISACLPKKFSDYAREKNKEYQKQLACCAVLGGVLGAICMK